MKAKPKARLNRLSAAQCWALATRVYHDLDRPQIDREREWMRRASLAHRAGNPCHLVRMVDVCNLLGEPPPDALAPLLAPLVRVALTGEKMSVGPGGRHTKAVRRAAEDVLAVESLMQREAARKRVARARVPKGHDAIAEACAYFRATAGSTGRGCHAVRSRAALESHAKRARKLLRDPEKRRFLGANFPPSLLDRLAGSGKKPR